MAGQGAVSWGIVSQGAVSQGAAVRYFSPLGAWCWQAALDNVFLTLRKSRWPQLLT